MFKCHFCRKITQPGTNCKKVVVQSRMYEHPARPKAMKRKVIKNGRKKMEFINDPGGIGPQIVLEVNACPNCAAQKEREQQSGVPLPPKRPSVITPEPVPRDQRPPRLQHQRGFQRY